MSDKYAALRAAEPYELRFSRLWERYDEACHGNAEHMRDILELALDALETAERRIAKSDRDVLELLAERDADRARIIELSQKCENEPLLHEVIDLKEHIAEMEARKLTVKLPKTFWYEHDDLARDVAVLEKRMVKKSLREACAEAGISLKIEGE